MFGALVPLEDLVRHAHQCPADRIGIHDARLFPHRRNGHLCRPFRRSCAAPCALARSTAAVKSAGGGASNAISFPEAGWTNVSASACAALRTEPHVYG